MSDHERHMTMALEAARAAGRAGNRPIASIIVRDGEILGAGQNTMFSDFDPSAHAEVTALRDACGRLKTLDLSGSTLYSTLEPCPMCFWAMQEAKVTRKMCEEDEASRARRVAQVADRRAHAVVWGESARALEREVE